MMANFVSKLLEAWWTWPIDIFILKQHLKLLFPQIQNSHKFSLNKFKFSMISRSRELRLRTYNLQAQPRWTDGRTDRETKGSASCHLDGTRHNDLWLQQQQGWRQPTRMRRKQLSLSSYNDAHCHHYTLDGCGNCTASSIKRPSKSSTIITDDWLLEATMHQLPVRCPTAYA